MATPKGMPEYAKGTQQAIAATKKATTPAKTPLANAPKAAISNAAATANSKAQSFDVTKANQNAQNAAQKATIANQVAKQAPTPTKQAFVGALPSAQQPLGAQLGDLAKQAVTGNTPNLQNVYSNLQSPPSGIAGDIVDKLRSVTGSNPVTPEGRQEKIQQDMQDAKSKFAQLTSQTYGDTALKTTNPYATGNADVIQKYTGSNVAPLTADQQKKAFEDAVMKRMEVERDLAGTRQFPMSESTLLNKAISSVNQNVQNAQESIRNTAPIPQGFPVIPPSPFTPSVATSPSSQQSPYVALGEAAKPDVNVFKNASSGGGIGSGGDGGGGGKPLVKEDSAIKQDEQVPQNKGNILTSDLVLGRQAVDPTFRFPTNVQGAGADGKGIPEPEGYLLNSFINASTPVAGAGAPVAGEAQPSGETKDVSQMTDEEIGKQIGEMMSLIPGEDGKIPVMEGATYLPQLPNEEDPEIMAIRQNTDRQLAALDREIADAQRNMDFAKEERLQNMKDAYRQIANQTFQTQQAAMQQMANRGLMTSGLYADAMLRTGMAANEKLRDVAIKQQIATNKAVSDMEALNKKIADKRQELLSGEATDIAKVQKEIGKLSIEQEKLNFEFRKMTMNNAQNALSRLARDNKINTAPYEAYMIAGDLEGLAQALQSDPNPDLNIVGRSINADLNLTKARIGVAQSQKQANVAKSVKTLSDLFGFVVDANGVPVAGKDGKVMPTFTAQQSWAKIQQQAANSAQTNSYRSELNRLKGLELERKIQKDKEDGDRENTKLNNQLLLDADKQRMDYFAKVLDQANSGYMAALDAYSKAPDKTKTKEALANATVARQNAFNAISQFYGQPMYGAPSVMPAPSTSK